MHLAKVGTDAGTDTGADASTDTGADAGADTGADASADTGADAGTDAWVAAAGGWSSSPKVARFPEAALRADDDLRATPSSCARAFTVGVATVFLAPDVDLRAIIYSIEESEHEPKKTKKHTDEGNTRQGQIKMFKQARVRWVKINAPGP